MVSKTKEPHWSIPDEKTAELMAIFFRRLTKGYDVREAFPYAQKKMKKKYPPYYRTGFVLIE
jgi:CHAT domain-containing protein